MPRSGPTIGHRPLEAIDALMRRGIQLIWLNLWWILLTLRGGILLGIGPATVGAHAVATAWARGEKDVDVPATMRAAAPRRLSTVVGLIVLAMLCSLAVTWHISRNQGLIIAAVAQGLVLSAAVILLAVLPYAPWVLAQREDCGLLGVPHVLLASLAAALSRPALTLALALLWIGWPLILVASGWPGLLPVAGTSVPLAACSLLLHRLAPAQIRPPDHVPELHDAPRPERTS